MCWERSWRNAMRIPWIWTWAFISIPGRKMRRGTEVPREWKCLFIGHRISPEQLEKGLQMQSRRLAIVSALIRPLWNQGWKWIPNWRCWKTRKHQLCWSNAALSTIGMMCSSTTTGVWHPRLSLELPASASRTPLRPNGQRKAKKLPLETGRRSIGFRWARMV